MNKKHWKEEAEVLRIILDHFIETAPLVQQKLADLRIENKVLSEQLEAERKDITPVVKENIEFKEQVGKLQEETTRQRLQLKENDNVLDSLRLKLQVAEESIASLKFHNEAGKSHVSRLENRELELLAEIKDLKENRFIQKVPTHFLNEFHPLTGEEVTGEHVYNNMADDLAIP